MINKKTLSWITTVPAGDVNFKGNLLDANKDTLVEALKDQGLSKAARLAIERRLRKIGN